MAARNGTVAGNDSKDKVNVDRVDLGNQGGRLRNQIGRWTRQVTVGKAGKAHGANL